jgi:RNA polymerase sigma factor (sigma-70 family)
MAGVPTPSRATAGDITNWVEQARLGNDEARRLLYERLAPMLQPYIRERLNARVRRRVGASEIFQELMASFFKRLSADSFALPDRDALFALLFEMIKNKVINSRAHHMRMRRNVRRDVLLGEKKDADGSGAGMEQFAEGAQAPRGEVATIYRTNHPITPPHDDRGDSEYADRAMIDLLTLGANPEDAAVAESVYDLIRADLANKPPLDLVFDRLLDGISNEAIARELGITAARVRARIGQIRDRVTQLVLLPEFRDPLTAPPRPSGASG